MERRTLEAKRGMGGSRGRVRVAAVLAIMVLMGTSLVAGWWYGQKGEFPLPKVLAREKPAPDRPAAPSLKFETKQGAGPDTAASLILEDRLADVAEGAMPGVVNVFSQKVVRVQPNPFLDDRMLHFFFGPGMRQVPKERREQSLGSGVVVTRDGYILTNNHVVEGASSVKVALTDKREFAAKIVGTDPETDLAVLKIEAQDLPAMPLGDSDKVRVGQVVLAIGNPFGLSSTVTMGIVSARGRSNVNVADYEDFIQTDAAVNPGNSGGALINLKGELIGVNTAIFSQSGGNIGIGFAIPSDLAKHVMESIIKSGGVTHGFLGVGLQEVTPELAREFGLAESSGALVTEVIKGSPAAVAGVQAGDVILAVNGEAVKGPAELRNQIVESASGSKATLDLVRDKDRMSVEVTLASRPHEGRPGEEEQPGSNKNESAVAAAAGMKVANLTPALADQLGLEANGEGVAVVDVESGSRAEQAGVQVGDVITALNRMQIKNVSDFSAASGQLDNRPILLRLLRQGNSLFILIPRK